MHAACTSPTAATAAATVSPGTNGLAALRVAGIWSIAEAIDSRLGILLSKPLKSTMGPHLRAEGYAGTRGCVAPEAQPAVVPLSARGRTPATDSLAGTTGKAGQVKIPSLSGLPGASTVTGKLQAVESRVVGALEDVDWVNVAQTVDKSLNTGRIELKTRRQALRPTVVVTYRGWYADGVAHLTARPIEKPLFKAGELSMGLGSTMRANLRRFTVLTMSGVSVRASMGAASGEFTSDEDGYLHIELPVGPLSPGWHVVDIDPIDGPVAHTTGRVLVPDPSGGVAVVSDIDDTIMKTGLTQGWTAAGRTLFRDVADRKPVLGMSTFYAGLARGDGTQRTVPFFYVSTGSWNLYDYLVAFSNLHRFPRGPLFLTDWGPTSDRIMRDGREHKRATIRALLEGNPNYRFVLIGDVGQSDPETYELMAREYPGRIAAIFLVYVGSHMAERSEQVASRAAALREEGIGMYYVENAVEAVTGAWQLGLVDQATTIAVAREFDRH